MDFEKTPDSSGPVAFGVDATVDVSDKWTPTLEEDKEVGQTVCMRFMQLWWCMQWFQRPCCAIWRPLHARAPLPAS